MVRRDVVPAIRFDVAAFGELLAEPSRVAILLALMDGTSRPATELAAFADVSPQTASSHFFKLVEGGLLTVEKQGRHRYYRIANERVAHALESMALIRAPRPDLSRDDPSAKALRFARTCYRHLAGDVGVRLATHFVSTGLLVCRARRYEVTEAGAARFEAIGMESGHRLSGTACLDWTERRHHVGGPLGVTLLTRFLAEKWLLRVKDDRAVRLTAAGARGFRDAFGLALG